MLISPIATRQKDSAVRAHVQAIDDVLRAEGMKSPWPWFVPRREREFLDERLGEIKSDVTGDLEEDFAKDYAFRWKNIGTLRAIFLAQNSEGKCDVLNHFLSFPNLNRGRYFNAAYIIGEFLIRFVQNTTWESFISIQTSGRCDEWTIVALDWLRLKIKCSHEELTEENLRLVIKIAEQAQASKKEDPKSIEIAQEAKRLAESCEQAARNAIARRLHVTHVLGQDSAAAKPDGSSSTAKLLNEGLLPPLDAGTILGKYTLLENIGNGSFGEVWKAHDQELKRDVALKFPLLPSPDILARMKREAQAAAKLEVPNIARVYDVSVISDRHFIAMEYVDGVTLDRFSCTSPRELLPIMRDIAVAIHSAHSKGVIHRDLKPGNIIIDKSGTPFVTDFGLALLTENTSRRTSNGTFVGTWEYASPEQRDCKETDVRSDVFSLGVTIHEVVTGTLPPIQASKATSIAKPYPPELHGLEEVVQKCLQRQPDDRYQTALDLGYSLDGLLPIQQRSLGSLAQEQSGNEDGIQLNPIWVPKDHWGMPGYDLLLSKVRASEADGATVSLKIPDGFALLRTAKPAGWHQDPSLDRPRVWLTPPESSEDRIRIGRLCFNDLANRLKSPKCWIEWSLKVPGSPRLDGKTELDLEALIPLKSRPALGSRRLLSFEECRTLDDAPYEVSRTDAVPRLEIDDDEAKQVLVSPDQEGAPTYLHFIPGVPLAESPVIRLRWRAKSSSNLMSHLFFGRPGQPDIILTLKDFKSGDVADRRHSEYEWVASLGPSFGPDSWQTLEMQLVDILGERFPTIKVSELVLKKISFRGSYRIRSIEFVGSDGVSVPGLPLAKPDEVLNAESKYVVLKCGKCKVECFRPWDSLLNENHNCHACGGVLHVGCAGCHGFPDIDVLNDPNYTCTICGRPSH